jgi:putative ABC transport system permease protein
MLTTLGILIGVAAVSAVVTLMSGTKDWLLHEFEAFGAKRLTVMPRFPNRRVRETTYWQTIFRPGDFDEMLEHCPSVESFSRVDEFGGDALTFRSKVDDTNISIYGADPEWHGIENRLVTAGRTLSLMDNEAQRPVCIINTVVRDKLEMDVNPVGQYLTVLGNRMLVVGLLESAPVSLANDADHREVVIPFRYIIARDSWPSYYVTATSKTPALSEDAKAEIEFYLRQKRRIKPGGFDTFEVRNDQRVVEQFNNVASMVTLVATGIVAISLLVGGVGIMNIMLVSVSERTREIGLRKAVGARPAAILLQFLVEAVVLCLIGGALGLALGQGLTTGVTSFLPPEINLKRLIVPPSAVALAFVFSAAVGLIFGFVPAVKASRLDPIEALRHE